MTSPKRRQREIAHAREDILEAAARAFARAGYARATMQDIAREAGYTAASLYTYFRSKEEIVEGLLDSFTTEYVRTLEEPLPSGLSFRQRFETVLRRQFELTEQRRPMFVGFQAMVANPTGVERSVSRCIHDSFVKRIEHLRDWFQRNAEPKELGNHDPALVAQFLFGAVHGIVHGWMLDHSGQSLVDRLPLILNLIFHGLSGPATPSRKHNP